MTEDIFNCCAMCLSPKGDDFMDMFKNTEKGKISSKYGKMYEDLLNLKIEDQCNFPSFICSSCSLQLQLSINLKHKALNSIEKIFNGYGNIFVTIKKEQNVDINFDGNKDFLIFDENLDMSNDNKILQTSLTGINDKDDYSNQSYESNCNENTFDGDECTEFLDIQYLKDDYDEEFENSKINQMEISINNSHNYMEDEEVVTFMFNENDAQKFNILEIQEISGKKNLKINKKNSFNLNVKHNSKKNEKRQTTRKKYVCDLCSRISYSKEAFEVHKKIHAGLPAFKCELCEKNFKQKVHYNIHMMDHTNERNYECEECGKKFKTKTDLRIHFEIHTGERRYVCDICHKAYRAHSHMKNHRYTHFEKQLECQICKQKYISPATLKTHIKTIHEFVSPQHECLLCHKRFKRKHHLQVHMKTHNKSKKLEKIDENPVEVLEMTNYIQEIEEIIEEVTTV